MTQQTIFVVIEYDWESSTIQGVFDSEELANEFIDRAGETGKWFTEPYTLNYPSELTDGGKRLWRYVVTVGRNGNKAHASVSPISWLDTRVGKDRRGREYLRMVVMAENEQEAFDLVNEHRLELLADGAWSKLPRLVG